MPETAESASLAPLAPNERIHVIDILRGFALFGVLAANMKGYSWPAMVYDADSFHTGMGLLDRAAEVFLLFVIRYKSVTLLSFLFGVGFSMQLSRAQALGGNFARVYLRRNLVLLGFGVLHIVLLWWLDILVYYALAAFILLLFRNASPKALRRWIAAFLILAPIFAIVTSINLNDNEVSAEAQAEKTTLELARSIDIHQHGSYFEILRYRLSEFQEQSLKVSDIVPSLTLLMVFILMGRWAGRMQILENVPEHLPLIRKAFRWGLLLGLPASLLYISALLFYGGDETVTGLTELVFITIGSLLFLSYAAGIVMLAQSRKWGKRLSVFAPVGRMTLTNYLIQSLICTTIFNGYGLGLYGKVGPAAALLLAVVIYSFQILLSRWWFTRFQFGPMEWIWRTLTYGKAPIFARVA